MKNKRLIIIGFFLSLSIAKAQPADFMVGDYILTNGITFLGPSLGSNLNNLKEGLINISIGSSPELRVFQNEFIPGIIPGFTFPFQITLDLSNNEIEFTEYVSQIICTSGTPRLAYNAASAGNNSIWSITAEDNNFTINYTENSLNGCGATSLQATFLLQKVPADQTYVPDDNFEQALIDLGFDTVLDNLVTTANIDTVLNLDVSNKNIVNLEGIEGFVALETLNVSANASLSSLSLITLNNLTTLNANSTNVNSLSVGSSIEQLYLNATGLSSINLSLYPNLSILNINGSPITGTITAGAALTRLSASTTNVARIDVSASTNLINFAANDCPNLTYINFKNNNNTNIMEFSAITNPSINCVEVSDVGFMQGNFPNGLDSGNSYVASCSNATQTYIFDANFEQALIDLGYDAVIDNYVTNANVNNIQVLDVSNKNIEDLRGVQAFVALDTLRANNNSIGDFDFSTIPTARFVNFDDNSIASVELTQNPNIENLSLFLNFVQSIDLLNNNNLKDLNLTGNTLTSLDLTQAPNLENLINQLSDVVTIDVSSCLNLRRINMIIAQDLVSLDLSQNTLLEFLRIGGLDSSSASTDYPMTTLDLSNNVNLDELIVLGGRISSLDLSTLINLRRLIWQDSNVVNIDLTQNVNLEVAGFFNNSISSIDFTQNTNLLEIGLQNNNLTSLDLSQNASLERAFLSQNNLSSVNTSGLSNLITFSAEDNALTSLDLSDNLNLQFLLIQDNSITDLDLSLNNQLEIIRAHNNQLTALNLDNGANSLLRLNDDPDFNFWGVRLSNNPGLTCVKVSDLPFMNTNFSNALDPQSSFDTTCSTASINDVKIEMSLYPNPATSEVSINVSSFNIEKISLYDITGRLVKTESMKNALSSFTLNIEDLNAGQYLLVVDTSNGRVVENLIKK